MPGFIGLPEIILFGIVALLVFGPKKLPEMGRSLGKGLREFKDSVSGDKPDDVVDPTRPVTLDRLPASDESNPFDRVEGVNAPAKPASNGTAPVA